jgi:glycosyltransferase involved in cell wall biosynthesis
VSDAASSPTVACLIAAHDEAERIAETVAAARSIPGVGRVVVVDDGSEDDTADLAAEAGAKVVRLQFNVGKGAALETGAARVADADVVLLLDADLGSTAEQGALLLAPVLAGDADLAVASFPPPTTPAGFGLVKRLAVWGIRRFGRPTDDWAPTAPLSGQRAFTRDAFETARPFSGGYGVEVTTTIRVLRAGMRVVEVPTTMAHAATGRDAAGFVHRGRQFVHVAVALLRARRS